MDVWGMYASDSSLSYGGMRSAYYRDYEQFPYGSLEQHQLKSPAITTNLRDPYSRVQEKCQQAASDKALKKECPFCKEHKRRPLVDYMRKRDSRKHHESICEDEEADHDEDDEDEDDDVVSVQCKTRSSHK